MKAISAGLAYKIGFSDALQQDFKLSPFFVLKVERDGEQD